MPPIKGREKPFANLNKGFNSQTPREFSVRILASAKKTNYHNFYLSPQTPEPRYKKAQHLLGFFVSALYQCLTTQGAYGEITTHRE